MAAGTYARHFQWLLVLWNPKSGLLYARDPTRTLLSAACQEALRRLVWKVRSDTHRWDKLRRCNFWVILFLCASIQWTELPLAWKRRFSGGMRWFSLHFAEGTTRGLRTHILELKKLDVSSRTPGVWRQQSVNLTPWHGAKFVTSGLNWVQCRGLWGALPLKSKPYGHQWNTAKQCNIFGSTGEHTQKLI